MQLVATAERIVHKCTGEHTLAIAILFVVFICFILCANYGWLSPSTHLVIKLIKTTQQKVIQIKYLSNFVSCASFQCLEKFSSLTHQVSCNLDIFMRVIHDTEFPNSVEATQKLLNEQGAEYERLKVCV